MTKLDKSNVRRAYARWAPVYDVAFARVMRRGRRAAAAAASRAGRARAGAAASGLVLDVGVGTGLELPMFDAAVRVVGIDISEPMLRRAQLRVRGGGLGNIAGLAVMDATRLAFADRTFEAAVAPFVITVVPDPERTLNEIARVVKEGGEIVLVNHIGATSGPVARVERWLSKRSAALGWRPEFPWRTIGDWIAARPDVVLVERRRLAPFGLFTLVRLRVGGVRL